VETITEWSPRPSDEPLVAGPHAIIVDLSQVRMFGPEELSALIRFTVRAGEADLGRCLVDGAWRLLVGWFEEAVLADLFEVYAVVDDALASLPPS